ncbi:hypothetical protein ACTXT7_006168 [Hymenolepis weldensis]
MGFWPKEENSPKDQSLAPLKLIVHFENGPRDISRRSVGNPRLGFYLSEYLLMVFEDVHTAKIKAYVAVASDHKTLLATHLRRRRNEADNQSSTLALEGQCSPDQRPLLHANSDMVTGTESPSEMWGGHETSPPLLPAERPQAIPPEPEFQFVPSFLNIFRKRLGFFLGNLMCDVIRYDSDSELSTKDFYDHVYYDSYACVRLCVKEHEFVTHHATHPTYAVLLWADIGSIIHFSNLVHQKLVHQKFPPKIHRICITSSSWIAILCSLQYLLDSALLLLSDSTSMLRRVLSAIGSFVSPTPAEEQAVIVLVDRLFAESMNVIKGIALSLDLPTHMPESFYAKLPFRRSSSTNNTLKSLMEDFELLTFYCKSNEFLKAVAPANVSLEFVQHSLDKLENVAIYLLATYFPVDELEEASARGGSCSDRLNLLLCLDVPATRDITPFPAFRPKKDHLIRFGYCQYQFASFLAYLSIIPESVETLSLPFCVKAAEHILSFTMKSEMLIEILEPALILKPPL